MKHKILTLSEFLLQHPEFKPSYSEKECGRYMCRNGYSWVVVYKPDNTYTTVWHKPIRYINLSGYEIYCVRG